MRSGNNQVYKISTEFLDYSSIHSTYNQLWGIAMKRVCYQVILLTFLMSGCSQYRVGQVEALGLEANERLVFNYNGKVCAEPSPDAVKSIAEALALKAENFGELSQSFSSSMASIGLRTAGIQILRDIGYRACEALANGVIDKHQYHEIVHGVDDAAIALVAVEGLTQMHPAPAAAISPGASGSTLTGGQPGTSATVTPASINFMRPTDQPQPSVEPTSAVANSVLEIVKAIIAANPDSDGDGNKIRQSN